MASWQGELHVSFPVCWPWFFDTSAPACTYYWTAVGDAVVRASRCARGRAFVAEIEPKMQSGWRPKNLAAR